MASQLKQRIQEDVTAAMRARDKPRLSALRLVTAAIKQLEVDSRTQLDDPDVLRVLEKMLKQRRDSLRQYSDAGRQDLADQESYEIAIIEAYMPEALTAGELEALIDAAIAETGANSIRDMGKVMGLLKSRVQGRADLGAVSATVKQKLNG
ncbi:MAG: CBU_1594 family Dot/Icm type IV secretion system effector [Gammaproteobacteria bacterium]|nr:MAG: CBU_1594 family Dot/Icm type IV secretion system effector [Gammaproteobacteria bacterium]